MSVNPVRLQLSRRKGFDLQRLSHETNGLPAVNCARPSKWGNPFRVGTRVIGRTNGIDTAHDATVEEAVFHFRMMVSRIAEPGDKEQWEENFGGWIPDLTEVVRELRGKNLACWCPTTTTCCHAQVLLEIANA